MILLGLGFTTQRLAKRLLLRRLLLLQPGALAYATVRHPGRFLALASLGLRVSDLQPDILPKQAVLVHTIPPLPEPGAGAIRSFIDALDPRRIVYISSTGVYGSNTMVTGDTPVDVECQRSRPRIAEERWIASGSWSSLILRSAAIYGPGRGVHVRVREGKLPRGVGSGVVSRIHVDDLAAILEAATLSDLEGAWPVADEHPCSSEEIVSWCARLLGIQPGGSALTFPVAGRNVDGAKIRELLGVQLAYPGYQAGILASLAEERAEASESRKISGRAGESRRSDSA